MQSGKGYLGVLKGNPKATAELIPADTVVNALLAIAWYQHARKSVPSPSTGSPAGSSLGSPVGSNSGLPTGPTLAVYNLTTNASRRLTWQGLGEYICTPYL